MCPFGDKKDIHGSCDGKPRFVVVSTNLKVIWIWFYLLNCGLIALLSVPQGNMCPFGDKKDIPGSCDGKSGFFFLDLHFLSGPFPKLYTLFLKLVQVLSYSKLFIYLFIIKWQFRKKISLYLFVPLPQNKFIKYIDLLHHLLLKNI